MTSLRSAHDHPQDADRVAAARSAGLSADHAAELAGTLSLLSEPTRLRILYALDHVEELCVGDLAVALDVGEDATSYALRLLRAAGLVNKRKDGRVVYYRLSDDFPEPLLEHCLRRLVDLTETKRPQHGRRDRR
ncbi:MAG: metalloregulator ArsR/SmtB family transcription factor [Actinomycetes bacterium]